MVRATMKKMELNQQIGSGKNGGEVMFLPQQMRGII